ncbi:MAG: 4Fe-4S binding protein [Bacteroidales bacterium]
MANNNGINYKVILRIALIVIVATTLGFMGRKAKSVESSAVVDSETVDYGSGQTELSAEMLALFPDAVSCERGESDLYMFFAQDGGLLGYGVESAPYSDEFIGYAGPTPILIGLDKDRVITGVEILPNDETRSFVRRVKRDGLFDSWNGLTIEQAIAQDVDAVSGATMTSDAVVSSLRKRLSMLTVGDFNPPRNWSNIFKDITAWLIVIFALVSYFSPSKMKNLRWLLLSSSAIVLGIWQGKMLSLATGYNWLVNGVSFSGQLVLIVMLALAFILPLVTKKPFYCIYVCPFGALQELMGKFTKKKVKIPQGVSNILSKFQPTFVALIVISLLAGVSSSWLPEIEPFAAFLIDSASVMVLILASIFLILSVFFQKPWCKFFCPTGYILDMTRRKK